MDEKERLPEFSRQISIHSQSDLHHTDVGGINISDNLDQTDVLDKGVYVLQTIKAPSPKYR